MYFFFSSISCFSVLFLIQVNLSNKKKMRCGFHIVISLFSFYIFYFSFYRFICYISFIYIFFPPARVLSLFFPLAEIFQIKWKYVYVFISSPTITLLFFTIIYPLSQSHISLSFFLPSYGSFGLNENDTTFSNFFHLYFIFSTL